MSELAGKSILVTGGSSGIGAAAAKYFAARGARVTIFARRADRVSAVRDEIGDACVSVVGDVTVAADRERAIAAALDHGGGLDCLVSNAGNIVRGAVETLGEQELLELFHSNVVAGMMLTGQCVDALERTNGSVIFVGSVHTRRAFPGAAAYAATKGALETLTGVLAAELGPRGVRVNCVVPGAVVTEIYQRAGLMTDQESRERLAGMAGMHALGRIGGEADVPQAMAYLIAADWATGSVLVVDGGLSLGSTDR